MIYTADGTIIPKIDNRTLDLGAIDMQIDFTGTIMVHRIGQQTDDIIYSSDGSIPYFMAVPLIQDSPRLIIEVTKGTVIRDISFKASEY